LTHKPRDRKALGRLLKFIRSGNNRCLRREIPERRSLTDSDVERPSRGLPYLFRQSKDGGGMQAHLDGFSARMVYPPDIAAFDESTQQLLK
jgi:hypothetical protein